MGNVLRDQDYPTNTLARGLVLIEAIAKLGRKRGVTLQELIEALGWHRSNLYRYLMILMEQGWVERNEENYRYHLGPKVLQVASSFVQDLDLRSISRPVLEELARNTCLAAHLAILDKTSVVYVDKVEGNIPLQMRSYIGMVAPCHSTALGKAMLATMTVDEIRALLPRTLEKRTANTIDTVDELLRNLAEVRQRGYALDLEENEENVGCIGAAIFGFNDEMVGAISISTLVSELTAEKIKELGIKVLEAANRISLAMGSHRISGQLEDLKFAMI
jgi:IclR family KDG regulon transcriptional repressor